MLIICNGVFKSGSTWLHAIVLEILKINNITLSAVPNVYTNNINSPTTIIESKLDLFLSREDYNNNHYITKSHYYLSKTINKKYDNQIIFLFIERDIKDAIVSHYYHFSKKYRFFSSFNLYYYLLGRLKAFEILMLNKKYKDAFGDDRFFKYSNFRNNFGNEISKISSILKFKKLSSDEIDLIKKNTTITKMRNDLFLGKSNYYSTVQKKRENVFRKGIVGDWNNHFTENQLSDIKILEESKPSVIFRALYYILFTLRRKIFNIE